MQMSMQNLCMHDWHDIQMDDATGIPMMRMSINFTMYEKTSHFVLYPNGIILAMNLFWWFQQPQWLRYSTDRLETPGGFCGFFAKNPSSTAQTHSQSVLCTAKHITKLRIDESSRASVTCTRPREGVYSLLQRSHHGAARASSIAS